MSHLTVHPLRNDNAIFATNNTKCMQKKETSSSVGWKSDIIDLNCTFQACLQYISWRSHLHQRNRSSNFEIDLDIQDLMLCKQVVPIANISLMQDFSFKNHWRSCTEPPGKILSLHNFICVKDQKLAGEISLVTSLETQKNDCSLLPS